MPPIDLKGVHSVTAKGRTYVYAWRGGPRLTSEPGSPAFVAELAAAHAARKGGDPGKISALVGAFRASDVWSALAPKTRRNWTLWLSRIEDHFGGLSIAQFDRPAIKPHIRRWHHGYRATARSADMGKQVLSRLLSYAVDEGKLATNACEGMESLYDVDRSAMIWTEDDLAELARRASRPILLAARLGALTGLRQGDLLRLTWRHILPHSIEIATGKSNGRRTTIIPIYAELRALLDELKAERAIQRDAALRRAKRDRKPTPPEPLTVLLTSRGQGWQKGFGASWQKTVKPPGDAEPWTPLHFHDLRGTAATRFYLGGLTIREIAEILAWSEGRVEQLLNRYVMKNALLLDRIRRLDEADAAKAAAKGEQG
jgi:integrase